jgi:hypothetical protein
MTTLEIHLEEKSHLSGCFACIHLNIPKISMQLAIAIIDAFTNQVFQGNPAATALVDAFPKDAQMQQIAAEINLSETAFVKPLGKNHQSKRFHSVVMLPLRWHIISVKSRRSLPIPLLCFQP